MLEILPAPDHVAAYHLSGTLGEADYDRVIEDIEAKLARHDRIGLLVDLTGFHDMTFRALAKDTRYSLSKMFELRRFPREAVVTDKRWIETLARLASPLVPFIEIRTFPPADRETALAWVSGIETTTPRA